MTRQTVHSFENSAFRPAAFRSASSRRGFALVLVLFLVILMASVISAFTMRTSASYRLTRSRAVSWRLYYAARAAIEDSKSALWRDFVAPKKVPGIAAPPAPGTFQFGGVDVTVTFQDEAGKLPVNDFAAPDAGRRKELSLVLARLFDKISVPSSTPLATAARDYIDEDTEGSYESGAKNEPLTDLSELLAIQRLTPDILYATKREGVPPMASLLTAWHGGAVNMNSADPVLLQSLAPRLTDSDAKGIIATRAENPFVSMEDLAARTNVSLDVTSELGKWAAFSTDTMTLKVEARLGVFVRRVEAVVWLDSTAAHTLYMRDGWQE